MSNEKREQQIYDMTFEEAQDYISKRGLDIPWNDDDVVIDGRNITQTVANVLAWADSHPQWIPVEDELPKENEEVLAYNSLYNEKYLCVYHNGKFEDYLGELGKGAVSHWMPIVPPRKEE